MTGPRPRLVVKFGGAALATGAGLAEAARRLIEADAEWKLAVVSAPRGMTDQLLELIDGVDPPVSPEVRSELVSFGERVSARLLTEALRGQGAQVRRVEPEDPEWPVVTRGGGQDAEIDPERTAERCRSRLLPELGRSIVVVCGFLGRDGERVTTLRRGGSDTTALALARFLDATDVVLVKDTPGIASADPRTVPEARGLDRLELAELRELVQNGARVVSEEALAFHDERVRFRVVPFGGPLLGGPGTEILPSPSTPSPRARGSDLPPRSGSVTVVLRDRRRGMQVLTDALASRSWLGLSATPRSVTVHLPVEELRGVVRALHDSGAFPSVASRVGAPLPTEGDGPGDGAAPEPSGRSATPALPRTPPTRSSARAPASAPGGR